MKGRIGVEIRHKNLRHWRRTTNIAKGLMRGDMQQDRDVAALNEQLGREKTAFEATRQALREALGPVKAPPDIGERLLSYAEEFGSENAVLMLKRSPKTFDIEGKVDRKTLAAVKPKVEQLAQSDRAMAGLVVRRENILTAGNPNHNRVYINNGREFTMNTRTGTVEYADGKVEKLELVKSDGGRAKQLRKARAQEEQEQKQAQGQSQ